MEAVKKNNPALMPDDGRMAATAGRLVRLYSLWGKPAEAAQWKTVWDSYPPPIESGPMPREVTRRPGNE